MDNPNSQKKSPRNSAKNERRQRTDEDVRQQHRPSWMSPDDAGKYIDNSSDIVSRVRKAKEAAQREMESFGDVSEYEVTVIQGQAKGEPEAAPAQPAVEYEPDEERGQN